jgi:hypothetical protein
MNITIFGGSEPKPDSPDYRQAYDLGKLLGAAGHTILTGGYIGTMEAASRGAAEAGGHVVGVTCTEIETWRNVKANAWVKEERRYQTLEQRLVELVHACDAAIALPGGPGTLTEIALTWNLMIVASIPPKPLILVGAGWKAVFAEMFRSLGATTPPQQRELLSFAADVDTAYALLPKP